MIEEVRLGLFSAVENNLLICSSTKVLGMSIAEARALALVSK